MLPFDSENLTGPERETERMIKPPNCWSCTRLVRHGRGGYRGCIEGIDIQPVLAGEVLCEEHEKK